MPAGRSEDEITLAARFAAVGFAAIMFDFEGGAEVAERTVAQWSGRALDPAVAADLKSPWFTGHSGGVARLARAAAAQMDPVAAQSVYRAGRVHDLGRVAVPTGIWERPGALRPEDWELVRLHPYHCGRILARSPVLAPLGQIACRHHERTDGTGYPAGIRGSELDQAVCLLAAWPARARSPRP